MVSDNMRHEMNQWTDNQNKYGYKLNKLQNEFFCCGMEDYTEWSLFDGFAEFAQVKHDKL